MRWAAHFCARAGEKIGFLRGNGDYIFYFSLEGVARVATVLRTGRFGSGAGWFAKPQASFGAVSRVAAAGLRGWMGRGYYGFMRRLRYFFWGVCLLLCLMTVIMWARGDSQIDGIRAGGKGYLLTLQFDGGEVSFVIKRDRDCNRTPIEVFHNAKLLHITGSPRAVVSDGEWSVLGVSFRSEHEPLYWVVPVVFTRTSRVGVSYWVIFVVTLVGHLWLFPRPKRVRAGYCANCGYDLRATPGRCPECGREV